MNTGHFDKPAIEGGAPIRQERLPFFRAPIEPADIDAVAGVLRSGWLTVGPTSERLEARIASFLSVDNVIAVASCSQGMHLALEAIGVGPGDEVITSSMTFASTVHAIVHVGATPVLVDIEPETFGLDPSCVEAAITTRTRAILPVHFGGQACRINEICALATGRGLAVVEDAAHAFGTSVDSVRVGAHGDAVVFSFYATKNLTTAEGGAVTTRDNALAERLRLLSYHGMSRDSWARHSDRGSWYYEVETVGFKANISDVLAAIGVSQMDRINQLLERRREIAERYFDGLSDCPAVIVPTERTGNRHTWHLFVVQLDESRLSIGRDRFIEALTEEGIGSSVHFIPIHHHPFYAAYNADAAEYPVCERYFSRCVSLPLYPLMSDSDADDVVRAVRRIAAYYGRDD